MMKSEITPAVKWPIGSRIVLLDAWMKNPIEVRVTRHPNTDCVLTEDNRGIVYFARTDRISGFAEGKSGVTDRLSEYDDILG